MHQDAHSQWDIKKVVIAVVFLAILGWFGYQNRNLFLQTYPEKDSSSVAGTQTSASLEAKDQVTIPHIDLEKKIGDITDQVTHLDVKEVATLSPQIQKVLKDMESLKNIPRSQAHDACIKICSSL